MIANLITFSRIFLVLPVAWLILQKKLLFSVILFSIIIFSDFLDGFLARSMNEVTKLGQILDPLADKILYITVLMCFIELKYIDSTLPIIITLREILITGLRGFLRSMNKSMPANNLGKIKTTIQNISVFVILIINNNYLNLVMMVLVTIISVGSGLKYINKDIIKELR